jgi:sialate O-acetylesterase
MRISSSGTTRVFQDILVGEVWFCSGQSNMDFTLASSAKRTYAGVTDWQKEVAAADHPAIRMFTAEWTMREMPQRDVEGRWLSCSPETAGDFSAAAYYFARQLQKELKTPVGLITSAYGASTIEAWIREDTLRQHPPFEKLLHAFSRKRTAFRDAPKQFEDYGIALAKFTKGRPPRNPDPAQDQHNPYVLHNGMIAPIAPYAIRGAIWYQGESNLGTRRIYPALQKALIDDWRSLWHNPKLPFYYVQLAAYKEASADPAPGGQIAEMREAQAASLAIPHTGMAVTIDIGDAKDIHPRNKRDVGERLARLALVGTYAKPGVPCGPLVRDASPLENAIRIRFDHGEGGLVSKTPQLAGFAIAGADRHFIAAHASIDGDSVVLSHPSVSQPLHARYAWADNPATASLFNAAGLPAAPFRTDP